MGRVQDRLKEIGKSLLSWAIVLAGLGLAWVVLHGVGTPPKAERRERETRIVPVTVAEVMPRRVERFVQVVGTLHGYTELPLDAKVDGPVLRIHKDMGDVVKPGELLLEIDPTDFDLHVKEAQRSLELELIRLDPTLRKVPQEFDITSVPLVKRAAAKEKNARLRHERIKQLGNSVSREEQEAAERDLDISHAEHKQALLEAQATLASARLKESLLNTAKQKRQDTQVLAPRSVKDSAFSPVSAGSDADLEFVICQRLVAEGQIIRTFPGATMPLFKLAVVSILKLKAIVPEREYGQILAGQEATVRVSSYPGQVFRGEVVRKSPAIDRASRTFEVEIHIPNPKRRLSPGSFASVSIHTHSDDNALTIPEEAVVRFAGVTKIFTLEGDRVKERQVNLGTTLEVKSTEGTYTWVELLTPLPKEARVVTSGQTQLADGTPVRLR